MKAYLIMDRIHAIGIISGLAALLGGCAKDACVHTDMLGQPIEFGTYLGRDAQTRADFGFDGDGSIYRFGGTVMNLEELKKTGFGVSAIYTGQDKWVDWQKSESEVSPNFMFKQSVFVTKDGEWGYEPIKYWPTRQDDKISFFAYAPFATDNNSYGFSRSDVWTSQHYSLKFTIQAKADEMVDFVAAAVMDRTYNGNKVTFEFQHALTRLLFSAKTSENMDSKSHVVITGARLVKGPCWYRQGNYSFTQRRNTNNTNDSYWGQTKEQNKDLIQSDYDLTPILAASTDVTIGGKRYDDASGNASSALELTSATPVSIFKKKGSGESASQCYLFLIPTSGSASDPGIQANTAAVAFDYDIVTEDPSLAAGYSCTSATKTVYLPAGIMQKGKAYNVTFTFNVDKIEVSADVEGWSTVGGEYGTEVPFVPDNAAAGE